jgi:hypothetical protein
LSDVRLISFLQKQHCSGKCVGIDSSDSIEGIIESKESKESKSEKLGKSILSIPH